jgi:secondary thiamine-phosphate synthase enzyme
MTAIEVETKAVEELIDITPLIQRAIDDAGMKRGICLVFVPHTTAGVTINENADPSVRADLLLALAEAVPASLPYRHDEGNSAAHVKAGLVGSSASLLVEDGRLRLGTWQAVYFCEFDGPRRRKVWVGLAPG